MNGATSVWTFSAPRSPLKLASYSSAVRYTSKDDDALENLLRSAMIGKRKCVEHFFLDVSDMFLPDGLDELSNHGKRYEVLLQMLLRITTLFTTTISPLNAGFIGRADERRFSNSRRFLTV